MTVGVVGLGLIGASLAKSAKAKTDCCVLGFDKDVSVVQKAINDKAIDGVFDAKKCDYIIIALYPDATIDFVKNNAQNFCGKTVIDCCGTKKKVCETLFSIAKENDFTFIGGHPMAGIEKSGYASSTDKLFDGAFMIFVPDEDCKKQKINDAKNLFLSLGFKDVTITTAPEHDRIIAYTSQLAHIVSSAYIKSPSAMQNFGFSAGSFRDMTRVALLNEAMWTQLFMENKDILKEEIKILIKNLNDFENALEDADEKRIFELLKDGKQKRILAWESFEEKK